MLLATLPLARTGDVRDPPDGAHDLATASTASPSVASIELIRCGRSCRRCERWTRRAAPWSLACLAGNPYRPAWSECGRTARSYSVHRLWATNFGRRAHAAHGWCVSGSGCGIWKKAFPHEQFGRGCGFQRGWTASGWVAAASAGARQPAALSIRNVTAATFGARVEP